MVNRFLTARKFAQRIINSKNLVPPIDPRKLLQDRGIEIVTKDNQYGIEAYSHLSGEKRVVLNTEFFFEPRILFTLAHELGHFCIPWHNGDIKCNTDDYFRMVNGERHIDTQELEANIFASELLMPTEWLKDCIERFGLNLEQLIKNIQSEAGTSVMACFYALENALPSGNLILVRKRDEDFWRKFKCKYTYTSRLYFDERNEMRFLDSICESKHQFIISQYEVIHYELLPCPKPEAIEKLYQNAGYDISALLNGISDYAPMKSLPFLSTIIDSLDDNYFIIFTYCGIALTSLKKDDTAIRIYVRNMTEKTIIELLEVNGFDCFELSLDQNYNLIIIRETSFGIPQTILVDPNQMLQNITKKLYGRSEERRVGKECW